MLPGPRPDARTPVTVLTGFLGAGKTTLLRRLLAEVDATRIAVVENELGAANIDGEIVEELAPGIVRRLTGCICCAVQVDLVETFTNLSTQVANLGLERVILETTGMAEPGAIVASLLDPAVAGAFRVAAVVTVADAQHIAVDLENSPTAQAQVALADRLLLNKLDLVDGPVADALERRLAEVNPLAERRRAVRGVCPAAWVLAEAHGDPTAVVRAPGGHAHRHDEGVGSVLLTDDGPHDLRRVRGWLAGLSRALGDDLLRVKGVVRTRTARVLVQAVRSRLESEPLPPRSGVPPETRVVLIGRGLDATTLAEGLRRTRLRAL